MREREAFPRNVSVLRQNPSALTMPTSNFQSIAQLEPSMSQARKLVSPTKQKNRAEI